MRVIGIDPGYDRLGVAVVERRNEQEILIFSACLEAPKTLSFPERVSFMCSGVEHIISLYQPDSVAIEKTFFSKNQKTAIAVSEVRGALLYVANKAGLPIFEYGPGEIKVAVTGYGKSDKRQVANMVSRLIVVTKPVVRDDEFDAIAIALTHLAHAKSSP